MTDIVISVDLADKFLEQFFQKDGKIIPEGAIRRSTLLACKNDFLFLRGVKLTDHTLNLTGQQIDILMSQLPIFAAILVYCSAIDLLARIMKRDTTKNQSKIFFLRSAKKWFGLSNAKAEALWEMRCAVSHQYKIAVGQKAVRIRAPITVPPLL